MLELYIETLRELLRDEWHNGCQNVPGIHTDNDAKLANLVEQIQQEAIKKHQQGA